MSKAKAPDQGTAEQTQNAAETIARASGEVIRETSARLQRIGAGRRCDRRALPLQPGAEAALRTGSSLAEGMQDVTNAWAHYAEEVMRQTSEASRALIGCRSLTEMFEMQVDGCCAATGRRFWTRAAGSPKSPGAWPHARSARSNRRARPGQKARNIRALHSAAVLASVRWPGARPLPAAAAATAGRQ